MSHISAVRSLPRSLKLLALAIPLTLTLAACSPDSQAPAGGASSSSSPAKADSIPQDQAYDTVAAQGKGFDVGPMMARQTVYVFFDPQCPHCAHLWQASEPLRGRVHFVWMPVAFLNERSLPQGVALLQASDPVAAMTAHEAAILAHDPGTVPAGEPPAELKAVVEKNTALLTQLGAASVPFIVARHAQTGAAIVQAGAMDTPKLVELLGAN